MAGARITVDYQDERARGAIGRLAKFGGPALGLFFADVGEYLLIAHEARFGQQQSPEGEPWAPLSPRYAARKAKARPGKPLLVYDNLLRGGLRYQVEGDALLFGTDRPYGATHQFGRDAIPGRPWLGLSTGDEEQVLEIALEHLERAAAGGAEAGNTGGA